MSDLTCIHPVSNLAIKSKHGPLAELPVVAMAIDLLQGPVWVVQTPHGMSPTQKVPSCLTNESWEQLLESVQKHAEEEIERRPASSREVA